MESETFKIGDKVIIVEPTDWTIGPTFVDDMMPYVGKEVTIKDVFLCDEGYYKYRIKEDSSLYFWCSDFFKKPVPYYVTKLVNYGK